jgi:hypothetical protein
MGRVKRFREMEIDAIMPATRYTKLSGLIAASLAITPPAHGAEGERLAAPMLPGFVLGFEAANARESIREDVPRGETVDRWTRMVTTQRFAGLAARSTPAEYGRTIAGLVAPACPGARVSPAVSLTVSGRQAGRFQVDCPRNQGGQRETFILLAIAGASDMHVKQVAFRGPLSAADLAWGYKYLGAVALCRPRDPQVSCR